MKNKENVKVVSDKKWAVESKDGYKVLIIAPTKNIARHLGVSELFNLGKNPNILAIEEIQ